jgi:hypothetical protein
VYNQLLGWWVANHNHSAKQNHPSINAQGHRNWIRQRAISATGHTRGRCAQSYMSLRMIDRNKIPDPLYFELIDLLGHQKAEEFVIRVNYNFKAINNKVLYESFKRRLGKRYWIYIMTIILLMMIYQVLKFKMII